MLKIFHKKKLFGNNIPPSCEYCRFSAKNTGGNLSCVYGTAADDTCKRYEYDPLKREPKSAPTLPTFTADDFRL